MCSHHRRLGTDSRPAGDCDAAAVQEVGLAVSSCVPQRRRRQHHYISGGYLLTYAVEMAWREDGRRLPNGALH